MVSLPPERVDLLADLVELATSAMEQDPAQRLVSLVEQATKWRKKGSFGFDLIDSVLDSALRCKEWNMRSVVTTTTGSDA